MAVLNGWRDVTVVHERIFSLSQIARELFMVRLLEPLGELRFLEQIVFSSPTVMTWEGWCLAGYGPYGQYQPR